MKTSVISALCLFILMSSCSTSRVVSSWTSPEASNSNIKKILVLGLTGEAERAYCVKMEQHLADDLNRQGYNAFAAYSEFGPKSFEKMTEKDALRQLTDKKYDAVITIVLLDKKKEHYYVTRNYKNYGPSPDGFWDYFSHRYNTVFEQGYYEHSTRYFWESNMYDLSINKIIFSSQTETFDPITANSLGHEYGKLIAAEMIAKNVMPASAKKPF